jgi:hypothetical protein
MAKSIGDLLYILSIPAAVAVAVWIYGAPLLEPKPQMVYPKDLNRITVAYKLRKLCLIPNMLPPLKHVALEAFIDGVIDTHEFRRYFGVGSKRWEQKADCVIKQFTSDV